MSITITIASVNIHLCLIYCYADWQWARWTTNGNGGYSRHYEIIEATVTTPCTIREWRLGLYLNQNSHIYLIESIECYINL